MQPLSPHLESPRRAGRAKYSFRAFYITILCICAYTLISIVADKSARYRHGVQHEVAQRRAVEELLKTDLECRLVHHADDKCAFIRANCPDEEAGLFSYLSLYYCDLNHARPVAFVILALWLALLFTTIGIAASDFFCINLSTIASILGMSESMAGVTFLAFGNGSPDVFSTFAAMSSHSGSLAVGELIGAAGFITAVVAGSMALVREFRVGKKTFVRDVGFFIVAASFSMVFLADGALHLWECCVMIGFYIFYVVTVVVWHWYLGRRRRRRERELASRGHYLAMTNEELDVREEDGDDEDAPAGERRYRDAEDFSALERGSASPFATEAEDSDEDGDQGMHLAAEMTSSMRVIRPTGIRRNTITQIRPSLVGALEFRSVLSSLQKSRVSNSRPMHLRTYSDDPRAILNQYNGLEYTPETDSENASSIILTVAEDSERVLGPGPSMSARIRAVSLNDADIVNPKGSDALAETVAPNIDVVSASPESPQLLAVPVSGALSFSDSVAGPVPASPTLSISPPPSSRGSRGLSPRQVNSDNKPKGDLALPATGFPGARHLRVEHFKDHHTMQDSPDQSPRSSSRPRPAERPRLQIPSSSRDSSRARIISPATQFAGYVDSPQPMSALSSSRAPSILVLPDSILSLDPSGPQQEEYQERHIKWWPYSFLPSPYAVFSTLFPTLCTWGDKTVWDKFASVISAPSIFLLAITLPVVETESQDDAEQEREVEDRRASIARIARSTQPLLTPDSPSLEEEPEWVRYRRSTDAHNHLPRSPLSGAYGRQNTAATAISIENRHQSGSHPIPTKQNSILPPSLEPDLTPPRDWNRWLVTVQIFTAPLFVVLIIWANSAESTARQLVRLILYSLLGSLIVFSILILTTTHAKPPKYRFLLCFLGFVVSIAWISTIANEVVGVLKAFGVILGISDAILGLTIFAVGNSLGDLVADITVARLGYPVMALSACFGGPMLNILLGIGISGLYMTITEANHKHTKHPGKKIKYKPYEVAVSGTLMVSAITLLVTLVGLLIAVPLNKWVMSRKIGWGLIILWTVTTVINLGVEISGVWGETATILPRPS